MRGLRQIFEIIGAVLASKMTGDTREHFLWLLKLSAVLLLLSFFLVRPV